MEIKKDMKQPILDHIRDFTSLEMEHEGTKTGESNIPFLQGFLGSNTPSNLL